jgi:hypothetical protein
VTGWQRVKPEHRSLDNAFTRGSEEPGEMHWIKQAQGKKGGVKRETWCGLVENIQSLGRGRFKASYARQNVTCMDCLVAEGLGTEGE